MGARIHAVQEKVLLRAQDVANQLKISRSKAYQMMRSGQIPVVKVGRSVRVRQVDVDLYILRNTFNIIDLEG